MRKPAVVLVLGLALGLVSATASAHEECADDTACATGEVCFEKACSAACKTDADCPEEQVCADATACQHTGEHEEEGGCATAATGSSHAFSLFGVALVAAAIRLARRRITRG